MEWRYDPPQVLTCGESDIWCDIDRAADHSQKTGSGPAHVRAELDSDGAVAGEGAGDGGAAVAVGGHTVIDLHIVVAIVIYYRYNRYVFICYI